VRKTKTRPFKLNKPHSRGQIFSLFQAIGWPRQVRLRMASFLKKPRLEQQKNLCWDETDTNELDLHLFAPSPTALFDSPRGGTLAPAGRSAFIKVNLWKSCEANRRAHFVLSEISDTERLGELHKVPRSFENSYYFFVGYADEF
jgi:hypothetical protein